MPATPQRLNITAKDLAGPPDISGGTYSEIEVPGDYELKLADVEDYDKRSEGKSHGWVFKYQIGTSTGPCDFNVYLSFNTTARWKMIQVFQAHGADLSEGIAALDPNSLVGQVIGGHVDFPRDNDGEPTSTYREIMEFFPLTEPPFEVSETGQQGIDAPSEPAVL